MHSLRQHTKKVTMINEHRLCVQNSMYRQPGLTTSPITTLPLSKHLPYLYLQPAAFPLSLPISPPPPPKSSPDASPSALPVVPLTLLLPQFSSPRAHSHAQARCRRVHKRKMPDCRNSRLSQYRRDRGDELRLDGVILTGCVCEGLPVEVVGMC